MVIGPLIMSIISSNNEVITLFFGHLRWGPLTVIHRPERVVRQFRNIQTIPPHPLAPSISFEEMNDRWMQFSNYIAPVGQICVVPGQYLSDYMDCSTWFGTHSWVRHSQGILLEFYRFSNMTHLLNQMCISNRWRQRHLMRQTLMCIILDMQW